MVDKRGIWEFYRRVWEKIFYEGRDMGDGGVLCEEKKILG